MSSSYSTLDISLCLQVDSTLATNILAFIPSAILGCMGGILGALFTFLNLKIARARRLLLSKVDKPSIKKVLRCLEPCVILVRNVLYFIRWIATYYFLERFVGGLGARFRVRAGTHHPPGLWVSLCAFQHCDWSANEHSLFDTKYFRKSNFNVLVSGVTAADHYCMTTARPSTVIFNLQDSLT